MQPEKFFTKHLLKWNREENKREMPWKNEREPYRVWISEIILQQTRVSQGLAYYNRFMAAFPGIKNLANAPETRVFKLWEGLGYYSRCRNIIETARHIANDLDGVFPNSYDEILKLKGVGSYTASAIASFAFGLPHAVVDGNVFRVLSRFFGILIPVDSREGKKYYGALAAKLLDRQRPGVYNQAIMDFGATVCKPLPLCNICPLKGGCLAFSNNLQQQLPVKEKVVKRRKRYLYYLEVVYKDKVYVRKRTAKDIWQQLYEFILIESGRSLSLSRLQATAEYEAIFKGQKPVVESISPVYRQQLTHQDIEGRFIRLRTGKPLLQKDYSLVQPRALRELPFPKFITAYLKD